MHEPTYRILITGSRNWTDRQVIAEALLEARDTATVDEPRRVVVVHGAARGADRIAAEWGTHWGWIVEAHPADWATHGKQAGPIRNAVMVSLGADVCLAFPMGESRGTRSCMRMAENADIPVVVHEGDPHA